MINPDGGSLPSGHPKPNPDYKEIISPERIAKLKEAAQNQELDNRLARNILMMHYGCNEIANDGLALVIERLLRTNRELSIRLYGVPCDLDGQPITWATFSC